MNRGKKLKWDGENPIGKPRRKKDRIRKRRAFRGKRLRSWQDEEDYPVGKKIRKPVRIDRNNFEDWDSDDDVLFQWRRTGYVSDSSGGNSHG